MNLQVLITAIIVVAALAALTIGCLIWFIKLPKDQKIANLQEWLKWAVVEAERALGSGTGQLKLRFVYDMAVNKFPWVVSIIDFQTFSTWVDEALEWMSVQLSNNKNAQNYVNPAEKE